MGGLFQLYWRKGEATIHFLVFWWCIGTVMAPLGISFSLLIEDQGLVEVVCHLGPHLILISACFILGLCHSFISCSLPPSFLFHPHCLVLTRLTCFTHLCPKLHPTPVTSFHHSASHTDLSFVSASPNLDPLTFT